MKNKLLFLIAALLGFLIGLKFNVRNNDHLNNISVADKNAGIAMSVVEVLNGTNCIHTITNSTTLTAMHCVDKNAKDQYDAPFDLEKQEQITLTKPELGDAKMIVTNNGLQLPIALSIKNIDTCKAYFEINQQASNEQNKTKGVIYYLIQGDSGAPLVQSKNTKEFVVGVFWKAIPNLPSRENRARSTKGYVVFKRC
ncbi:MAG: hypothetical protein ACRCXZ_10140 [Patescibacteria group bacterium]